MNRMETVMLIEIIKVLPNLIELILLIILVIFFYKPIRYQLLPNLTSFKALGVEFSFINNKLIEASQKLDETPSKTERSIVAQRAKRIETILQDTAILWVDDNPGNNVPELSVLQSLGISVSQVRSSKEAFSQLSKKDFDVVVSDMDRDGKEKEGISFLSEMKKRKIDVKTIFYVQRFNEEKGVPPFAFGITNRPDHLLHLLFDAIERTLA
jgi:CheY-like chemotaxis protein